MTKKISFKNKSGHSISGVLNLPPGRPPFPAVVICHGFKGYKEQNHLKTLAIALAKSGVASLRFDFTNEVGESYGSIENIKFSQELGDLKSAIDYVCKQKFIKSDRIGLAGHSLGGQLVVHYAPTDKRVKALVGLAGSYIHGQGKTNLEKNAINQMAEAKKGGYFYIVSKRTGKKYKIKIDFYFDLIKHNTLAQAKKIKIPAMLIHGSKDSSVHISSSKIIYNILRQPKKIVEIQGAPHTWRGKDDPGGKFQKQINQLAVSWFKKYLLI